MKITEKWLKKKGAVCSGLDWYKAQKTTDPVKLIDLAINDGTREVFNHVNWGITKYLNKRNLQKYAIYAAKQVLPIFEKNYPEDKRPREAIRSAEKYLKSPTVKNRNAAYAYASASVASAYASASDFVASYAASAAASASSYASASAFAAAVASSYAAYASAYASASDYTIKIKILRYAKRLIKLQEGKK